MTDQLNPNELPLNPNELSDTDEIANDAASQLNETVNSLAKEEITAEDAASEEVKEEVPGDNKQWYILKVQVNREDSIKKTLEKRIKMSGLDDLFEEIIVPVEEVSELRNGKKKVTKKKLYPGYLIVHMEITDDTWFLVRETSGIGDFTGAGGKPIAMSAEEVRHMLQQDSKIDSDEMPKLRIPFQCDDKVKIIDGTFKDIEGQVSNIDEATGRITVIIPIFARSTPIDMEYWQVEKIN